MKAPQQPSTAVPIADQVDSVLADAQALYLDLHRHPELPFQEKETAAKLCERMQTAGYKVTFGVGGTGVVAVLQNGSGPTVLMRTELDALPVQEKTGVPYASTATMTNNAGVAVPVMHACGHDLHMAVWYGAAKLMSNNRDCWHGTLVFIGQPAEEIGSGAVAMLKDGLYTRFPKPDYALAFHVDASLPVGTVGYTPEYNLASADAVDITIFGRGSHGAEPHKSIDPIVIGARTVLALQTIVAREVTPGDPAVVTVGCFQGGTQNNIIPDEVRLYLTVRTYKPATRKQLLAAIERIAKAEALAGGAPREPLVNTRAVTSAAYNDPELTNLAVAKLRSVLGPDKVAEVPPKMAFDDYSEFGLAGAREVMLVLGAVSEENYAAAQKPGAAPLPGLHSPVWAPDYLPALRTGITSETACLLEFLNHRPQKQSQTATSSRG